VGKIKNLKLEAEEYGFTIDDSVDTAMVANIVTLNHTLEDLSNVIADVISNLNDVIETLNGSMDILNKSILEKDREEQ